MSPAPGSWRMPPAPPRAPSGGRNDVPPLRSYRLRIGGGPAKAGEAHMGLKGDLGELPLSDFIEMTSLGGKTGRLHLYDAEGRPAGDLAFREGRLVGASVR